METTIIIKMDDNGLKDVKIEQEETVKADKTEIIYSQYARFFDDSSPMWTKDPEYNLMFLSHMQDLYTDLLKVRGHLFLNEVYDALGIPRTKAGQIVGWIYDRENPIGDNYVDFGIYSLEKSNPRFVNGHERSILLDFNVDGCILDKIK